MKIRITTSKTIEEDVQPEKTTKVSTWLYWYQECYNCGVEFESFKDKEIIAAIYRGQIFTFCKKCWKIQNKKEKNDS